MNKHDLYTRWHDWMAVIAGIIGPLTSLIFEDKYTPRQIISRLIVGAGSAAFLGTYLADFFDNVKLKGLIIYLCGVGGYYLIKGAVKVFEMFGVDPKGAASYVWSFVTSFKKPTNNNENNDNPS
jgi:hypothetical protein